MRVVVSISRLRIAVLLLLAFFIAGPLTLHQHSLIPESGGATPLLCPVCAFDADQASLETPLFGDALQFAGFVANEPQTPIAAPLLPSTVVRGPPAHSS